MIMEENNMNDYKVLITTSGIGFRLGELTKYTNKSLVRIGRKPAISYIIESYNKNIPIIITIGYFGKHVKDFVLLAYPDRNIEFVEVDNYDGPGSSLGYSMLQARDSLQCPFIYHAGDTIVEDKISAPDRNWVASFKSDDTSQYASLNVVGGRVVHINDKGATDYDDIHIGLVGINQYNLFWELLEKIYSENSSDSTLNDVSVINKMIHDFNSVFEYLNFETWLDIGNTKALNNAREKISDRDSLVVLDKLDESIYLFDDFVVKFFHDEKKISDRVKRANILKGLTPEIDGVADNFYRYKYVKGDVFSRVVTPANIGEFLIWTEVNLWKNTIEVSDDEFRKKCHEFYYDKTLKRLEKIWEESQIEDKEDIINGEVTPPLKDILKLIDFDWLSNNFQSIFHGDFILDNIIKTDNGYCLIDWRQNFSGLLKSGDKYYDLAKLNHNLTVNHDIIKENMFTIDFNDDGSVVCDIMRRENLVACQKVYHNFLIKNGYDLNKVELLTAIIWLNMSPLHHHPFNLFLYYFGKLNLWRIIKNNK